MLRGIAISGRVIGPDGAAPPAGGRLSISRTGAKSTGTRSAWPQGRVAADGTFTTHLLDPAQSYDFKTTDFPGAQPGYTRHIAAGSEGVPVRLTRGYTIRGRVIDEAGVPIGGVPVSASKGRHHVTTRADDHGRFTLDSLESGTYDVHLNNPTRGFEPVGSVSVTAGTDGVVIRARRLLRVTGRVVDGKGNPVRCRVKHRQFRAGGGSRGGTAPTDNDGRFSMVNLRPGTVVLTLLIGTREIDVGEHPVPSEDLVLIAR